MLRKIFRKRPFLLVLLVLLLIVVTVSASLQSSITISSTGNILVSAGVQGVQSQIRGVLIGQNQLSNSPDFATIASTLATYGINTVDIDVIRNYETAYQSAIVLQTLCYPPINFTQVIAAFHAKGIQVYAHFSTMYKSHNADGVNRNCWYIPYDGKLTDLQEYYPGSGWLDIANPATWPLIKSLVTELVSNYNIDGITFDYTRWDETLMPLGNFDKLQFIADTSLSNATWPNDVVPVANGGTGLYFNQFMEWRTDLVNTFVKNITQSALAINPHLKFGATPHGYGGGLGPSYWRFYQGQDVNYWISKGYIQWVAPMIYSNDTSVYSAYVKAFEGNATGGIHGLVQIVPCITNQIQNMDTTGYSNTTPSEFASYVNAILSSGGDGWFINEYGGPGFNSPPSLPDIRPFLAALGLPNPTTFVSENPTFQELNSMTLKVTWRTTLASNSSVEYSSSPLYTWALAYDPQSSFNYWKITHVSGTLITNATPTTTHTVVIEGLKAPCYIHIMSGDPSGTATLYMVYMGG